MVDNDTGFLQVHIRERLYSFVQSFCKEGGEACFPDCLGSGVDVVRDPNQTVRPLFSIKNPERSIRISVARLAHAPHVDESSDTCTVGIDL